MMAGFGQAPAARRAAPAGGGGHQWGRGNALGGQ